MVLNSLHITEGIKEKIFQFEKGTNLIWSDGINSTGKTTLIRLLLYSFGYNISSTRGMNFSNCTTILSFSVDKEEYKFIRNGSSLTATLPNKTNINYILPVDFENIKSFVYKSANPDIYNNMLGASYIDQDRGWTLLNRGFVIGRIYFNIDKLILGLSEADYLVTESRIQETENHLTQYSYMADISKYRDYLSEQGSSMNPYVRNERIEAKIVELYAEKNRIQEEIKQLNAVVKKNYAFKNYIENMSINIKTQSGEIVPVNEKTIVDFQENQQLQQTKMRMLERDLITVEASIETNELKLNPSLLKYDETTLDLFNQQISAIPINKDRVQQARRQLRLEKKELESVLNIIISKNNPVTEYLNKTLLQYAAELGIEKYVTKDGILTSDIQSLSGRYYYQLVLIFRFSFVKAIEKFHDLTLPIIIDSPSGRELSFKNIQESLSLLNRDFSNHQIILASIHKYDFFDYSKEFLLTTKLMD